MTFTSVMDHNVIQKQPPLQPAITLPGLADFPEWCWVETMLSFSSSPYLHFYIAVDGFSLTVARAPYLCRHTISIQCTL